MGIRWEAVEASLGMPLPQHYEDLADLYGPGTFNDHIRLHHPHRVTEFVNLTGPVPGRIRERLRRDYDVPLRGRVPREVREAWERAHSEAAP